MMTLMHWLMVLSGMTLAIVLLALLLAALLSWATESLQTANPSLWVKTQPQVPLPPSLQEPQTPPTLRELLLLDPTLPPKPGAPKLPPNGPH